MIPSMKVLLTTNFSLNSRKASAYAIQLFGTEGVEYVLMNSYFEPPIHHDVLVSINDLLEISSQKKLEEEKSRLVDMFPDLDIKMEIVSVYGIFAASINQIIDDHEISFAVMGIKKWYSFDDVFLRSKAAETIRKTKCPVLVVPEEAVFSELDQVTFATDFQEVEKLDAFKPFLDLAKKHQSEIAVLNVCTDTEMITEHEARVAMQLDHVFSDIMHEFHAVHNDNIVDGIRSFSKINGSKLIVLLARKRFLFSKWLHKSTTRGISQLSTKPFIVLHDY
jgi:nucleotide-binding universal stress UspA family protein